MSRPVVMLLDANSTILSDLRQMLAGRRFDLITARSAQEALQTLEHQAIAVVVTALNLPVMEGPEFLSRVQDQHPRTVRVLAAEPDETEQALEAMEAGQAQRTISHPPQSGELVATIEDAVTQYQLIMENRALQKLTQQQKGQMESGESSGEDNTRLDDLQEKLRQSFLDSVRLIWAVIDAHRSDAGSHARRLSELCRKVASKLGRPRSERRDIEFSALLHDLGKLGLPERIGASLESQLGDTDRQIFDRHPSIAERVLQTTHNLSDVGRIIRHQLEHWNGHGKPDGLSGEEIPFGSRLLRACCAWDEILNTGADGREAAEKHLATQREQMFDPTIVDALLECVEAATAPSGEGGDVVSIEILDLREGMVMAKDLRTPKGLLLLPAGTRVAKAHISQILRHQAKEPMTGKVHVTIAPSQHDQEPIG